MAMNRARVRELLADFDFRSLFVQEMGWNSVPGTIPVPVADTGHMRRQISEMSGVTVHEVFPADPAETLPDAKTCERVHREIEKLSYENVLIFLNDDRDRTQSMMYWVKREDSKRRPRRHYYFKGQPGDLFMSKIDGMVIEMDELREDGSLPITDVTGRLAAALDIEKVTKRFYNEFSQLRIDFIELIEGIPDDSDRYWYASVLLNRLMFIYFLQKKAFIQNNGNYLDDKLDESRSRGADRYYSEFLAELFFEGFAKPERERSPEAKELLGPIPFLNGGLFLRHNLENENSDIRIPDKAFENVLGLFGRYSWHLDDTPGARDNEINPDVLGYIFEKYINQKAFGAYYTRSEITDYLCERSIHSVILQRINQHSERKFTDLNEALMRLDARLCGALLSDILPKLSILDPACGSGAFLVAALKNLLNIYGVVYGKIDVLNNTNLSKHLSDIRRQHPSINYYIRKQIITSNLYGVDIMDEATEIARLRLFLALVSSAQTLEQLEPLPNIDFNVMTGNSLIGLLNVDEKRFDDKPQMEFMFQGEVARNYRRLQQEKNLAIRNYRFTATFFDDLQTMRRKIDELRDNAYRTLNDILLDDFRALKIQYEQAQLTGKAKKRQLETSDINALKPFHWGYEFDEIIETRGGFDVIITNPPWEVFKPIDREFAKRHDPNVSRRLRTKAEFRKRLSELLKCAGILEDYIDYLSNFPHISSWYRNNPQYKNQVSLVAGRRQGTDINLYKLFTEQCFNLLREGGACGVVIPSGIYSDLGTKQLRRMLFGETQITGLFSFENRKTIFEGVDSRLKFVVLTYLKGGQTARFPTAFMRHDVRDLEFFPNEGSVTIDVDFIKRLSPTSFSVTEFKQEFDAIVAAKLLRFPMIGDQLNGVWNVRLHREFDMTIDNEIFLTVAARNRLPLYEGKMIWHYTANYAETRYWVDENIGRERVLGKRGSDNGQLLDYQQYRFAYRAITGSTNERTMVCAILPKDVFFGHSLSSISRGQGYFDNSEMLCFTAVMSSFVVDFSLRQRVATQLTMFYVNQTPIPRLTQGEPFFDSIVHRAAQLICTTPEFDELAAEVGLGSHHNGVTDPVGRAKLRAELDGIIAQIYGLSEEEFRHILGTFPLVEKSVRDDALQAWHDVADGKVH
ncbi:MAG: hypothetical protein OXB89_02150 [Anaerolineaceae bacterium]|nr:hypothetical protein [Anaerolineaceae bacterium]